MECKNCGRDVPDGDNFCGYCSSKVVETCDCWVLKKPYNCGHDECPGYRLSVELIKSGKIEK